MSKDVYTRAQVVTPHATNPNEFQALWIGGTGTLTYRPSQGGVDVLISAIPVGQFFPIGTKFIRATGTTATLIIGFN